MGWAAIIAAVLQIFGPLLAEWLRKWLDDRLQKAAAKLGDPAHTDPGDRAAALFNEAIAALPHAAFLRRALLRRLKSAAVLAVGTGQPVPPEVVAEIEAAARAAADE